MSSETLAEKIVALHRSLESADLVHAFGGAFALAYCTLEPRATRDIDVNVFVSPDEIDRLASGLPPVIEISSKSRTRLTQDGQCRLWWHDTPVDIFLSTHPFHDQVQANRRFVHFAGIPELPVLACADLAVFKTFSGRSKDAIDIAAMIGVKAVDIELLERETTLLLGDAQQRADFFDLVRFAVPDYEPQI